MVESGDSCIPDTIHISRDPPSMLKCSVQLRAPPIAVCLAPYAIILSSSSNYPFPYYPLLLILARGLLACLQLVQVPAADGQVAVVLRHAGVEVLDVTSAHTGGLGCLRLLVLLCEVGVLGRGLGGRRAAAAEEAADGVADGGSDSDTAVVALAFVRD